VTSMLHSTGHVNDQAFATLSNPRVGIALLPPSKRADTRRLYEELVQSAAAPSVLTYARSLLAQLDRLVPTPHPEAGS
jgi:hypothetical protein